MYEVTMPKLSDSMEVGKIIQWRVKEGDSVSEGDVLAEVESDKAVMELECFQTGVVTKIAHGDDSEVQVGEVIALIGEASEAAQAEPAAEPESKPAPKPQAPPAPAQPKPTPSAPPRPRPSDAKHVAISPYAKKLAEHMGVDYTGIAGSGPGGRIVAKDIETAAKPKPAPAAPGPQAPAVRPPADEELPAIVVTDEEAEVEDASFRLKTQARRVVAAKHVIPHFYITRAVDVTELLRRKPELKERYAATVTHLVMLACLKALQQHPEINRSYDRGKIIRWKGVNLGIAIGTDDGLTVAVIKNAQTLGLKEIAESTPPLVERARAGKLTADERQHSTFTISNLGMYDVEHFQPIVNPPSAVTLGVASALPAPVIRDSGIYFGQVMRLTASCDHRIIDGIAAATFLGTLKSLLENPDELLQGQ